MAQEVRFTISRENASSGNAAPKTFTLKKGASTPVRIGRAPGNDIIVDSRGVSQYHAELRVVRVDGESTARLCVRDLSMNGTGVKRPDGKAATHLDKRTDVPLADGYIILVPMMLKVSQETSDRAWLKVELESSRGEESAPQSQAAQQSTDGNGGAAEDDDVEKARMKFVELLLKTREVSAGTTYEDAKKLLGSSSDWDAVEDSTRKECFDIFVEHLGSHQSSKKRDKKKGKDKEKDKTKKNKGREEEAAGAVATPEPKVAPREEKKRRERRGAASRSAGGSPDRKRKREKKGARRSKSRAGRSASPGDREKRRRRVRSGSA